MRWFGYDADGEAVFESATLRNQRMDFATEYNNQGVVTRRTYPDGRAISFEHDAAMRPSATPGLLDSVQYDSGWRPQGLALQNGVTETFGLDALMRPNRKDITGPGGVTHASLGVQVGNDTASHGAKIVEVTSGGAAAAAGLPSGVVVTKVDDRVIGSADALVAAVRSRAPGDKVTLTYLDPSGKPQTVQVTLGKAAQ